MQITTREINLRPYFGIHLCRCLIQAICCCGLPPSVFSELPMNLYKLGIGNFHQISGRFVNKQFFRKRTVIPKNHHQTRISLILRTYTDIFSHPSFQCVNHLYCKFMIVYLFCVEHLFVVLWLFTGSHLKWIYFCLQGFI